MNYTSYKVYEVSEQGAVTAEMGGLGFYSIKRGRKQTGGEH